ncbi:MAG: hypothetical protein Kow0092_12610 [Deferrisomatales bacterium]
MAHRAGAEGAGTFQPPSDPVLYRCGFRGPPDNAIRGAQVPARGPGPDGAVEAGGNRRMAAGGPDPGGCRLPKRKGGPGRSRVGVASEAEARSMLGACVRASAVTTPPRRAAEAVPP